MNLTYCSDYREMSIQAATLVIAEIEQKRDLLLCVPSGHSPSGLYEELIRRDRRGEAFFGHLRIVKLDEWGGIPLDHPASCESFLKSSLLDPLGIPREQYLSFDSDPEDPPRECRRIESALLRQGPIDLCILGMGRNGHLGLNEPGDFLDPGCHVATLSEATLQHSMISSFSPKPRYGLTLGMREILAARKIILLISGQEKGPVIQAFLTGRIDTSLPASFLWLHGHVECLFDHPR